MRGGARRQVLAGKMPLWATGTPGPLKTHWETAGQVLKEAVGLPVTSWVCFGGGGSRVTSQRGGESLPVLSGSKATQGIGSGGHLLLPNPAGTKSVDSVPRI